MNDVLIIPTKYIKFFSIAIAVAKAMLVLFAFFHIIGLLCLFFNTSYTIIFLVFSYLCGILGLEIKFSSKNLYYLSLKADIEHEKIVLKTKERVLREISISDITSIRIDDVVWHWDSTYDRYIKDLYTQAKYICVFMNGNVQIPTTFEEIDEIILQSNDFFMLAYREDVYDYLCNLLKTNKLQNQIQDQYWEPDA